VNTVMNLRVLAPRSELRRHVLVSLETDLAPLAVAVNTSGRI
jgi:hypothetical protein